MQMVQDFAYHTPMAISYNLTTIVPNLIISPHMSHSNDLHPIKSPLEYHYPCTTPRHETPCLMWCLVIPTLLAPCFPINQNSVSIQCTLITKWSCHGLVFKGHVIHHVPFLVHSCTSLLWHIKIHDTNTIHHYENCSITQLFNMNSYQQF
jgi:hypothetical protein